MLRFRPKLGSERNSEWRCIFCLHVRTGTILLGTWQLMLHLIALSFLAAIVRDPRLLDDFERETAPAPNWSDAGRPNNVMPTPLSNIEPPPSSFPRYAGNTKDQGLIYNDVDVGALITVLTLAITLMLIYGAARGKPAHLLPFFCLQIFDFAITVVSATGSLCYLRSIHVLIAETHRVPFRDQLLRLHPPTLALVVISFFLLTVLVKGYCINIVWRCYKYLTMRAHAIQSLTPFVISSDGVVTPAPVPAYAPAPAPDYSSLLPDYDEAVKQSPPPSYRAATLMAAADPTVISVEQPAAQAVQAGQTGQTGQTGQGAAPAPAATTVVMLPAQGSHARV